MAVYTWKYIILYKIFLFLFFGRACRVKHHSICENLDLFPPEIWFWKWSVICLNTCVYFCVFLKKGSVSLIWLDICVPLFLLDSVSVFKKGSVCFILYISSWSTVVLWVEWCVCLSPELSRSALCCPILLKPATDRLDWSSPSPHSHCELTSSNVNWN